MKTTKFEGPPFFDPYPFGEWTRFSKRSRRAAVVSRFSLQPWALLNGTKASKSLWQLAGALGEGMSLKGAFPTWAPKLNTGVIPR